MSCLIDPIYGFETHLYEAWGNSRPQASSLAARSDPSGVCQSRVLGLMDHLKQTGGVAGEGAECPISRCAPGMSRESVGTQ